MKWDGVPPQMKWEVYLSVDGWVHDTGNPNEAPKRVRILDTKQETYDAAMKRAAKILESPVYKMPYRVIPTSRIVCCEIQRTQKESNNE